MTVNVRHRSQLNRWVDSSVVRLDIWSRVRVKKRRHAPGNHVSKQPTHKVVMINRRSRAWLITTHRWWPTHGTLYNSSYIGFHGPRLTLSTGHYTVGHKKRDTFIFR